MNPVLKYRGGKSSEIPLFEKHIPRDFDRYLEPFLGGGAVFFHLEPERAVLNDANGRLMGFYWDMRNEWPRMRRELDALGKKYKRNQAEYQRLKARHPDEIVPNANEDLYYEMRRLYNHPDGSLLPGTAYFFINKTAYSGMVRYNRAGEYNVPFGRYPTFNPGLATDGHSDLLRRAELLCGDYSAAFAMAGPGDFMFLDPPYDCVFNDYGGDEFGEDEHRRLAADFRNLPCRALMIVGETALTRELYGEFVVDGYRKNYAVNIRNHFRSTAVHMVVRNY